MRVGKFAGPLSPDLIGSDRIPDRIWAIGLIGSLALRSSQIRSDEALEGITHWQGCKQIRSDEGSCHPSRVRKFAYPCPEAGQPELDRAANLPVLTQEHCVCSDQAANFPLDSLYFCSELVRKMDRFRMGVAQPQARIKCANLRIIAGRERKLGEYLRPLPSSQGHRPGRSLN